jgi:hypothetical protein
MRHWRAGVLVIRVASGTAGSDHAGIHVERVRRCVSSNSSGTAGTAAASSRHAARRWGCVVAGSTVAYRNRRVSVRARGARIDRIVVEIAHAVVGQILSERAAAAACEKNAHGK